MKWAYGFSLLLAPFNFLVSARRARKKISDRWNNVCARRPENIDFWRGHCSTTVPCPKRGAGRHFLPQTQRRLTDRASQRLSIRKPRSQERQTEVTSAEHVRPASRI